MRIEPYLRNANGIPMRRAIVALSARTFDRPTVKSTRRGTPTPHRANHFGTAQFLALTIAVFCRSRARPSLRKCAHFHFLRRSELRNERQRQ